MGFFPKFITTKDTVACPERYPVAGKKFYFKFTYWIGREILWDFTYCLNNYSNWFWNEYKHTYINNTSIWSVHHVHHASCIIVFTKLYCVGHACHTHHFCFYCHSNCVGLNCYLFWLHLSCWLWSSCWLGLIMVFLSHIVVLTHLIFILPCLILCLIMGVATLYVHHIGYALPCWLCLIKLGTFWHHYTSSWCWYMPQHGDYISPWCC